MDVRHIAAAILDQNQARTIESDEENEIAGSYPTPACDMFDNATHRLTVYQETTTTAMGEITLSPFAPAQIAENNERSLCKASPLAFHDKECQLRDQRKLQLK